MRRLDAFRAVRVEEGAVYVDDARAPPAHAQARLLAHVRDDARFEVLLVRVGDELVDVAFVQDDGHALLAFRYGQLCAVEPLVFARHRVQVDIQPVCQLAHGHGHAARAEIVAALHQTRRLAAPKQPANFALGRCVAFLHLGAQGGHAFCVVCLARPGGPADAVASRASAHEHDRVAWCRRRADHVDRRCRAHDRAYLHALGGIPRVVNLAHLACGDADLVAVARISFRRLDAYLALRQLACKRLGKRRARVCGAAHAHGLVDPRAPGQRVAYAAAYAGGRPAEGLDLGGVVVRLVFEEEQPVLVVAVHVGFHLHRAGVHLVGFVEVGKAPACLQPARRDCAHVHEGDGLVLAPELFAQFEIAGEGRLHTLVVEGDVVELRVEGGVAAVVGPVGVYDAQLGDGGLASLVGEMRAHAGKVFAAHGKAARLDEAVQLVVAHAGEALQHLDVGRAGGRLGQRLGKLHLRLAGFDGVDEVSLRLRDLLGGDGAFQQVEGGRAHGGACAPTDELYAFRARIRALVELAGQVFHRDDVLVGGRLWQLFARDVALRLGEDAVHAALEIFRVDALDVVALHDAHPFQPRKPEVGAEALAQLVCPGVEAGPFFHEDASGHGRVPLFRLYARSP